LGDPDDLAGLAVRAGRDQHPQRVGEPLLGGALRDRRGGRARPAVLPAQITSSTASRNAAHACAVSSSPAARAATSCASKAVCSSVTDFATLNVRSKNATLCRAVAGPLLVSA
jgi:hypothetical protein